MAEYYGIGGKRRGSVGNETYAILKGINIVKSKIIKTKNVKSRGQVIQRCKMISASKALDNLSVSFLKKCFESKKRLQSDANSFMSLNTKNARIINKEIAENSQIISFGNWQVTAGSLPGMLTTDLIAFSASITKRALKLTGTNFTENSTVADVSTDLLTTYPFLKEGMIINAFCIENKGVTYNADSFITIDETTLDLVLSKQNFILSKTDDAKITTKGFLAKTYNNNSGLIILEEDGTETVVSETGIVSYLGFFASQVQNGKTKVQNCYIEASKPYRDVLAALDTDLNGAEKALNTYGYNKGPEIVDDNAI